MRRYLIFLALGFPFVASLAAAWSEGSEVYCATQVKDLCRAGVSQCSAAEQDVLIVKCFEGESTEHMREVFAQN